MLKLGVDENLQQNISRFLDAFAMLTFQNKREVNWMKRRRNKYFFVTMLNQKATEFITKKLIRKLLVETPSLTKMLHTIGKQKKLEERQFTY